MQLTLRGVSSESEHRLPACDIYHIEGANLLSPDGQPVARHSGGSWWADDACYTALYTESPCVVHFENADARGPKWGPYEQLKFVDGILRAGADSEHLIATLIDAFAMWALRTDGSLWRRVVLSSLAK
ncbi:MAG TPA: hypothetical protein VIK18_11510 [Pirellulales bacterium]